MNSRHAKTTLRHHFRLGRKRRFGATTSSIRTRLTAKRLRQEVESGIKRREFQSSTTYSNPSYPSFGRRGAGSATPRPDGRADRDTVFAIRSTSTRGTGQRPQNYSYATSTRRRSSTLCRITAAALTRQVLTSAPFRSAVARSGEFTALENREQLSSIISAPIR